MTCATCDGWKLLDVRDFTGSHVEPCPDCAGENIPALILVLLAAAVIGLGALFVLAQVFRWAVG